MDVNSGKSWSEMDLEDLRHSIDYGDTFAQTASFLCRDETRSAKAKELGLVARKRQSAWSSRTLAPRVISRITTAATPMHVKATAPC